MPRDARRACARVYAVEDLTDGFHDPLGRFGRGGHGRGDGQLRFLRVRIRWRWTAAGVRPSSRTARLYMLALLSCAHPYSLRRALAQLLVVRRPVHRRREDADPVEEGCAELNRQGECSGEEGGASQLADLGVLPCACVHLHLVASARRHRRPMRRSSRQPRLRSE